MNNPRLLRPLSVFLEVARQLSFRRAASELGISAPLASQIVSQLEEELGQQLLYRSTRKVVLTAAGAALVEGLKTPFDQIDTVIEGGRSSRNRPSGRLRITVPTVLAQPAFARFLARYADRNPDLSLEIDVADDFQDPLAAGLDLAIRIGRVTENDRIQRVLFKTEGILCAGSGSSARQLADLEGSLFVRPKSLPAQLLLFSGGTSRQIIPARQMVLNNGRLIRDVLRHQGFAAFPAFAVKQALASGELIRVAPEWSLGPLDVTALYTARRARLSLARDFVDQLVAFIDAL